MTPKNIFINTIMYQLASHKRHYTVVGLLLRYVESACLSKITTLLLATYSDINGWEYDYSSLEDSFMQLYMYDTVKGM